MVEKNYVHLAVLMQLKNSFQNENKIGGDLVRFQKIKYSFVFLYKLSANFLSIL